MPIACNQSVLGGRSVDQSIALSKIPTLQSKCGWVIGPVNHRRESLIRGVARSGEMAIGLPFPKILASGILSCKIDKLEYIK